MSRACFDEGFIEMKTQNEEREDNGQMKRKDSAPCPFYDLGAADFHGFRTEIVEELRELNRTLAKQCELLATTIEAAVSKSTGVPLRTHLYTIIGVIFGILGAEVVNALMDHIK